MKAKLLKKIKKRFVIHYYPNGYSSVTSEFIPGIFYQVIDNKLKNRFFNSTKRVRIIPGEKHPDKNIYPSHEEALNACKNWILNTLKEEFYMYSNKHKKAMKSSKKVWYNQ